MIPSRLRSFATSREPSRAIRSTMTALLLGALAVGNVQAQTVRGRFVDPTSGGGIPGVQILANDDWLIAGGAVTDSTGNFELRLPRPGTFSLETTRTGYRTRTLEVTAEGPDVIVTLGDISLETAPIVLDEVRVEIEREGLTPGREWIRQRQLAGKGIFLSGATIAEAEPVSLTQYLGDAADLWVRYDWRGRPSLVSQRSARRCIRLFVNHWPIGAVGYGNLDNILLVDIAAIEIYPTHRDVPAQLTWQAGLCGAVNVWTWNGW
jgi:hypothetical protein